MSTLQQITAKAKTAQQDAKWLLARHLWLQAANLSFGQIRSGFLGAAEHCVVKSNPVTPDMPIDRETAEFQRQYQIQHQSSTAAWRR